MVVQASGNERLLKDVDVAAMLGVSRRRVWSMVSTGSLPEAIKVGGGRSTRWRLSEVHAWIEAGCPSCARVAAERRAAQ